MPTRAQLRRLGLTRQQLEEIQRGGDTDEEEEKHPDTEDEDEQPFDHNTFDFDAHPDFLGNQPHPHTPEGQQHANNLYAQSDHCKRHRKPDGEPHTPEGQQHANNLYARGS